ncbi:MAG: hypothetical protein DCF15_01310 [Phormidesmis priestleyi]|uniref:Uncharacterized protein n=1 Tax=Phormidesmis priestleyi TaxID=268141 RepID=A0A2W4ZQC6_9CYAN|nr:MAG: hypothetical protein DCF15_01310 [Phormidesmis priestleyi]
MEVTFIPQLNSSFKDVYDVYLEGELIGCIKLMLNRVWFSLSAPDDLPIIAENGRDVECFCSKEDAAVRLVAVWKRRKMSASVPPMISDERCSTNSFERSKAIVSEAWTLLCRYWKQLLILYITTFSVSYCFHSVAYSRSPWGQFEAANESALKVCRAAGADMCEFRVDMLTEEDL